MGAAFPRPSNAELFKEGLRALFVRLAATRMVENTLIRVLKN
jgi:hypothetical protein